MKYPCSLRLALAVGLLVVGGGAAAATGDAAAGAKKSQFCATCHGADGNTTITGTPRLAGQSGEHFAEKMKLYRSGKVLYHPMMAILTNGLNEQDVADLGAFYASQKPQPGLKPYSSPMLP
jgi:cytochrome c553